jgi:dihydroneopterin aldolase
MDRIILRDLVVDCIVGILPHERTTTQRLVIDLDLELPLDGVAQHGDLRLGVDYAEVADRVRTLATEGRYELLETFARDALALVLAPPPAGSGRAAVQRARIRVRKPDVLGGNPVVGVDMARDAAAFR